LKFELLYIAMSLLAELVAHGDLFDHTLLVAIELVGFQIYEARLPLMWSCENFWKRVVYMCLILWRWQVCVYKS